MTRLVPLLLAIGLAACAAPPEAEEAFGPEPAGADYPELMSIEAILTQAGTVPDS